MSDRSAPPPPLLLLPSDDPAFAAAVRRAWARADGRPELLPALLAPWYPHVAVRRRDGLASLVDGSAWYVYRDGAARPRSGPWWDGPDVARVECDDDGMFLAANDAACALLGYAPGALVGRSYRELLPAAARTVDVAFIRDLLRSGRTVASTVRFSRVDGTPVDIEYRCVPSGEGRHASAWRAVTIERGGPGPDGPA